MGCDCNSIEIKWIHISDTSGDLDNINIRKSCFGKKIQWWFRERRKCTLRRKKWFKTWFIRQWTLKKNYKVEKSIDSSGSTKIYTSMGQGKPTSTFDKLASSLWTALDIVQSLFPTSWAFRTLYVVQNKTTVRTYVINLRKPDRKQKSLISGLFK